MRFLIASLTILLTLSAARADEIEFCFLFCAVKRPVINSFCQNYTLVNQNRLDAAAVKGISRRDVKVRLNANDVKYLCQCRSWKNPICEVGK